MKTVTLVDVFATLHAWTQENGIQLTDVVLRQSNGKEIQLAFVPPPPLRQEERARPAEEVGRPPPSMKMLKAVYAVLPDHEQEPIAAKVVIRLTGYRDKSGVYHALRILIGKGKVERIDGKYRRRAKAEA